MIENLPILISIFFAIITVLLVLFFYRIVLGSSAQNKKRKALFVLTGLVVWMLVQAVFSLKGFYRSSLDSIPPRIMIYGILPPMLVIFSVFVTHRGRAFSDSLPLKYLTLLHVVRVPVELVLLWLFLHKTVPLLMTFEGRNFDIISGITAAAVAYFAFVKGRLSSRAILIWNFLCLGLLINIVVNALLSVPTPLQRFGVEQPNIAILYFPFVWLPTVVVPLVLFSHLASIRQLMVGSPANPES